MYDQSSAADQGSMCANMNVTGNTNAKTKNVEDNFNSCKDYVDTETEAFLVAAVMQHFDMNNLSDEIIPPEVASSTKKEKCLWLQKHMKLILEKFVMEKQAEEHQILSENVTSCNKPKERPLFLCSVCGKQYFYEGSRNKHEKIQHNKQPHFKPSQRSKENTTKKESEREIQQDHIYNYACTRLSLGMLIMNFNDAVKEGDGERLLRCWKFMLLIYKAFGHTKYALAALQLLAYSKAILSPSQAHSLIWNRTVNSHGGAGKNISLDLRMEHLVHLLKEMISNLGVNVNQSTALRCSKAVSSVEKLLHSINSELEVHRPSGKHTVTRSASDFETIVNELHNKGKVFDERIIKKPEEKREYRSFPEFPRSITSKLKYTDLNTWINKHKKKWSRQGF